jgi:hypothetical protein
MNISRELIDELWKIRLPILNMRRPQWILETFLLPLMLLVLPLSFNQQIIFWLCLGYGIYLASALTIFGQVRRIKKGQFRIRYSYQLSTLLYGIFDMANFTIFGAIFWDAGIVGLNQIGILNESISLLLFGSEVVIVIVAVVSTRQFLLQKIKWASESSKSSKYQPLIFALASVLPSMAILIGVILSRTQTFLSNGSLSFAAMLFFVIANFLIPFAATSLTEILWIGLRKWPDVHKSDSEFIVTWP